MKRYMLWATLALAAIALVLTPTAATAQGTFTATFSGSAFPVAKDGAYYVYELTGSATHLGPSTDVIHRKATGKEVVGFATITGASGDSLFIESTGTVNGTETDAVFKIVGGTGRFASASGGGTSVAVVDAGIVTITMEGTISF